MTLWSIQSVEAWKTLKTKGVLRCDVQLSPRGFSLAYQWMADQMDKRLRIRRPVEDALPLWAWYQSQGERRKKPDLRTGGHLRRGERGVRIELEIDRDLVLLSDFELWHCVLNGWYLPTSVEEGEVLRSKREEWYTERLRTLGFETVLSTGLPRSPFEDAVEDSWERIFDLDWTAEGIAVPRAERTIQATFWELPLANVRRADEFVAR